MGSMGIKMTVTTFLKMDAWRLIGILKQMPLIGFSIEQLRRWDLPASEFTSLFGSGPENYCLLGSMLIIVQRVESNDGPAGKKANISIFYKERKYAYSNS